MSNNLPERLKELRGSFRYSQAYVSRKLNISRQTYSHYETGRICPPSDSLAALARLYHVSIDYLLADANAEINMENKNSQRKLSEFEQRLLHYFFRLEGRDQKDILDFIEIKYRNRVQELNREKGDINIKKERKPD